MSIFQLYRGEYKLNSIKDLESLKTRPVLELTISAFKVSTITTTLIRFVWKVGFDNNTNKSNNIGNKIWDTLLYLRNCQAVQCYNGEIYIFLNNNIPESNKWINITDFFYMHLFTMHSQRVLNRSSNQDAHYSCPR